MKTLSGLNRSNLFSSALSLQLAAVFRVLGEGCTPRVGMVGGVGGVGWWKGKVRCGMNPWSSLMCVFAAGLSFLEFKVTVSWERTVLQDFCREGNRVSYARRRAPCFAST